MAIRHRRPFGPGTMLGATTRRLRQLHLRLVALRIRRSCAVAILGTGLAVSQSAPLRAQDATQDQIVAMADTEVLRAIEVALVAARSVNGTTAQYLAAVQPYAPLDLQILRPNVPPAISRRIRDFYIAAVGKQNADRRRVAQWHSRAATRRATRRAGQALVASLDVARSLVKQMRALNNVTTIAAWTDGWSVDSLVYRPSGYTVRMHSPILALVPWREATVQPDAATNFLQTIGTSLGQVNAMVTTMRSHNVAAVTVSLRGNARVVMTGSFGPDAAGLLFVHPAMRRPPSEASTRSGTSTPS